LICKICHEPGPEICQECEREIKERTRQRTAKIQGRAAEFIGRLERAELMKYQRKVV